MLTNEMSAEAELIWRLGRSRDLLPIPGEQVTDPIDRVIGDAGDEVAEISLGIEAIELGGFQMMV